MDYFESLIKTLLEAEGYWVQQSFKVNLSKEEKKLIGKPSAPRPEIDLLAFKYSTNEILVIEAKSFLDSPGVRLRELTDLQEQQEGRYKLFTSERYRSVVMARLHADLNERGMADSNTRLTLGLAAGKIYQQKSDAVRKHMREMHWWFWSPEEIRQKVLCLADRGYENDPAIITAKIVARQPAEPTWAQD